MKQRRPPFPLFVLGLILTVGCTGRSVFQEASWPERPASEYTRSLDEDGAYLRESVDPEQDVAAETEEASAPPLLGWDGGVVAGAPQGGVRPAPPRGLEPTPSGRMHILELYQQVLDERDVLRDEVASMHTALERSRVVQSELEGGQSELSARMSDLEARVEVLRGENDDLAARLATAQIRRLEAEKMLLEARITELRRKQAEGGQ